MPISAEDAHALLRPFCSFDPHTDNAGIAISKELVRRILENQIARTNTILEVAPSGVLFENLRLGFKASVDASAAVLSFADKPNPEKPTESFPSVTIEQINVTIEPVLDKNIVASLRYTYDEILGQVVFEQRQLRLLMYSEKHPEPIPDWFWENDSVLKQYFEENHGFNQDTWNQLQRRINAIDVFSGRAIAESILRALEFPDLLSMFVGVEFGNDVRISAVNELIMLTATTKLRLSQCPFVSPVGETRTRSTASIDGGPKFVPGQYSYDTNDGWNPELLRINVEIDETSPALGFPSDRLNGGIEQGYMGHVFFYTPIKLLEVNFDGVFKPAIHVSDSGSFGPINWGYSLTAAVTKVHTSLSTPWPITFVLSTQIKAYGQARASIEVGCVQFVVGGAIFEGQVDPLDTEFRIYYDWQRQEIVFESRLKRINAKDFFFKSFPPILWPLSEIIDILLARIAEKYVTDQAGRVLAITRIPIARLNALTKIAPLVTNSFPGFADDAGNATFGVNLELMN